MRWVKHNFHASLQTTIFCKSLFGQYSRRWSRYFSRFLFHSWMRRGSRQQQEPKSDFVKVLQESKLPGEKERSGNSEQKCLRILRWSRWLSIGFIRLWLLSLSRLSRLFLFSSPSASPAPSSPSRSFTWLLHLHLVLYVDTCCRQTRRWRRVSYRDEGRDAVKEKKTSL